MGIISNIDKSKVGEKLKALHVNSLAGIEDISANIKKLSAQLTAMKANTTDYSAEDCKEVEALITDIQTKCDGI